MEYSCECCNFITKKKYNYDKHILSNKHKLVEGKTEVSQKLAEVSQKLAESSNEISNLFKCKYCEQGYKHKSSLSKHIKYSCTKNKTEDLTELVRLLNLQLEQQKNEFETKLQTQTKQIEKLMDKLEINTYTNSNNTIINNVTNINLLNYKDTDTSHLTNVDYKKCLKEASRCVLKLIEKVHFNPDKPENMNIYIPNIKNNYMMVYNNGNWELKCKKDALNRLYDDNEQIIENWIELNNDPQMKKFFDRYLNMKDKELKHIYEEIKLLMHNKRNMIEKDKL
jgi:hypothetical protein